VIAFLVDRDFVLITLPFFNFCRHSRSGHFLKALWLCLPYYSKVGTNTCHGSIKLLTHYYRTRFYMLTLLGRFNEGGAIRGGCFFNTHIFGFKPMLWGEIRHQAPLEG
jgi:hypothetical protein